MRRSWLVGTTALACALGACGPKDGVDSGTPEMDSAVGTDDSAVDMDTGRHQRDVNSGEVNLADTLGTCYVGITPPHGPASGTFVAAGQGFSDPMIIVAVKMGGTVVGTASTIPSEAGGTFMYTIPTASLAPGMYTLTARDMSTFTCQFDAPFTIE